MKTDPIKVLVIDDDEDDYILTKARAGNAKCLESGPAAHRDPESIIDQTQLASLREIRESGTADFVTALIDIYLGEVPSTLRALNEAVLKEDMLEVRKRAHFLKGSSGNIGATGMAELSAALENQDSDQDVGQLLARLEHEFEVVGIALSAERRGA